MRLHQVIPETGQKAVAIANKDQFDLPQRFQPAAKRLNLRKRQRRPLSLNHSPVANSWLRKRKNPLAVQLQQGHPTAHLLRLAIGTLPVEPLADAQRQCPTRYRRLRFNGSPDSVTNFVAKLLAAYPHGLSITQFSPCVQPPNLWDTINLPKGDNKDYRIIFMRFLPTHLREDPLF